MSPTAPTPEPPARTLEPLAPDLWVATRELPLFVGDVGARMTVMRFPDGALMLHSPVAIDAGLSQALEALGSVRWIVAPNKAHHLFLHGCASAFPGAELCGVPGLGHKRPDLRFHHVLDDTPPAGWPREVRLHRIGGMPALNEVALLHEPTRTLVLADLVFNVRSGPGNRAAVFHWLVGATDRFGPHRVIRLVIRDRAAARRSIDRILAWDFDRIVMSHGEVVPTGGRPLFERAFAYLRA